jgi:hypothetical protein
MKESSKYWWIKYSLLTVVMAGISYIWLNSVPADDPGDIVGIVIACVVPLILYAVLLLGFIISDLKGL